ncbi:endonuclease domain-containing protein [Kitasatospora cineracea]|uniref:endonuclease domain-containing protein n=1 Tax=Kitasatospora cineracea TaxID=88074 RepID=UPI0036DEE0E1
MTRRPPDEVQAWAIEELLAAATAYRQGWLRGEEREKLLKDLTVAAMRLPEPEQLLCCPGRATRPVNAAPAGWYAVLGTDGLHHPLHPDRWGWACSCSVRPKEWRGRGAPRAYGVEGPAVPAEHVQTPARCARGYWPIHLAVPESWKGKEIPAVWTRSERAPVWWVRVQLWNRQGGLCAVCRAAPGQVIDHSHDSGLARGLLCSSCNRLEGQCAGGEMLCPPDRAEPCFPEYWADPPAAWLNWTHTRHSTTLNLLLAQVCGVRCPAVRSGPGPRPPAAS